jgi:hypothetical protein
MCYNQKEACIDYVKEHMSEIVDNLIKIEKNKNQKIDGDEIYGLFNTIYISNTISNKEAYLRKNCPDEYENYNNEVSALLIAELINKRKEINEIISQENNEQENNNYNNNSSINVGDNFIVTSDKAYFYESADYDSRTESYLINNDVSNVREIQNGFVYTTFTNSNGNNTSGWISMNDVRKYQ